MPNRNAVCAIVLSAVSLWCAFPIGSANAQEKDKAVIVACMLEKTTAENKTVMKNVIIAALQDNEPEVRKNLILLSSFMLDLAMSKCSMSFELMNENEFGEIGKLYGQKLGEGLMTEAFANLK